MLVKFDPTLGTSTSQLRAYNFMRVVTAVATAEASSTPVVHPLTAQDTVDSNVNLITEVIANSEAGGWTVSGTDDAEGHNLPDATYTDANLQNRVYRADFFRETGKAQFPFAKFTIKPQYATTWTSAPYLDIICGLHTETKFTGTYADADEGNNNSRSPGLASLNLTAVPNNSTFLNQHSFRPNDTGIIGTAGVSQSEWLLAVTANYFILIQPTSHVTYFGMRTTQPWEIAYDDNPPVVAWHTPLRNLSNNAARRGPQKSMMAWWRLKDGNNEVRSQPYLSAYQNITSTSDTSNDENYVTSTQWNTQYSSSVVSSIERITSDGRRGNLFNLRHNRNFFSGDSLSNGIKYYPVMDPTTGVYVPSAHPIQMQLGITESDMADPGLAFINEGGRCLGIYKSLSGTDEFMNKFYVPGQTFVVEGENYYPYVIGEDTLFRDMFLIRRY